MKAPLACCVLALTALCLLVPLADAGAGNSNVDRAQRVADNIPRFMGPE